MSREDVAMALKKTWKRLQAGWPENSEGFELWQDGVDGYIEETLTQIEGANPVNYVVAMFSEQATDEGFENDVDSMINGAAALKIKLSETMSLAPETIVFVPHIRLLGVIEAHRGIVNPGLLVESVYFVGHGSANLQHNVEGLKSMMVEAVKSMTRKVARKAALKVIAVVCYGGHEDMMLRDAFPSGVAFYGGDNRTNTDVCHNDEWVHNSFSPGIGPWTDEWGCTWSWYCN